MPRGGHPQPPGSVEGEIEGLTQVRLRRDELDREARWEVKQGELIDGGTRPGVRRVPALGHQRGHDSKSA
jgi:hypothetical protein